MNTTYFLFTNSYCDKIMMQIVNFNGDDVDQISMYI